MAAGLPRIRFLDARHGLVSWAHEAGIDMETISKLVGHSSTAVTR
jgi:integrase